MSVPRGNSAGAGPVSGSVPGRRTVLHCPLPASQRSRIRLLCHGHFLCQLLPKMWTSMIVFQRIRAFYVPSVSLSCPSHRPSLSVQHQVYEPSIDPQVCCGSCKNISCTFTDENRTTDLFAVWVTHLLALCSIFSFFFFSAGLIMFVYAGREFLGGELYTLRLCGNSSGSSDTCLWGCLSTF